MLTPLFEPKTIAVIGASTDPAKVGYSVLYNLITYGFSGRICPVNPSAPEILGLKAYRNVSEIDGGIDCAVIVIPAAHVPAALSEAADSGARAAVIISAGFKEAGRDGVKLEDELRRISKERGISIVGPNCLGIINTANNMNATFAGGMLPKGRIAFFSQSGALGIAILDWAIGNKIGFSKFISLGNKVNLNEVDFMDYLVDDSETDVILGYIEDVVNGRAFLESAKKATKKKPVIILKSGGTEAGARAASSHTGALAGSETAFRAAFKQSGIIKAEGIQDLFDAALAFAGSRLPRGDRLLVITNAGGPGIIAADAAEKLGVNLPQMTKESIDRMQGMLPSNASLYNPVDIIGDATSERYSVVIETAVKDPNVDALLVILTPQAMTDVENTADIVIKNALATDKPVIACFMGEERVRSSIDKMKLSGIPNFSYPEIAVKEFRILSEYSRWRNIDHDGESLSCGNKAAVNELIDKALSEGRYQLGEDRAMEILSHYGFVFPERGLAKTAMDAVVIAERIGFPVAMKIASPDILHKTDVGGIKLNINTPAAAEDAFLEITSNVQRFMPDAFINGVMIYEMIKGGREVILGVTYDRTFKHMLMFGLGGIYVEVLKDVSFRVAPVSRAEAEGMINEIRTSALLRGARGEKPADINAVIDSIIRLSCLVADFPLIHELDVNPLMVLNRGAFALDARIILEPEKESKGF
ncbi:MAG: acetate--CoA ligase family protein [Dissulfurispiraceae bacterium]|jgi:acetyltransferase|nr:acetate--CoA ligase family protein [Dissulfurispiraceae bacterium]